MKIITHRYTTAKPDRNKKNNEKTIEETIDYHCSRLKYYQGQI
jgi:hypothetical protein